MRIVLDFETFYSVEYQLSKLTTMQYINDSRFKVWGAGVKIDDLETEYYPEDELQDLFDSINWDETDLICHNASFDGSILSRRYGIVPKRYIDTASMMRGLYPGQSASLKSCAIRMFPDDETKRKTDDLVKTKGLTELSFETHEALAKYCINDVNLTFDIYAQIITTYPETELAIIDQTVRMLTQPVLRLNVKRAKAYKDEISENTAALIAASGYTREQLASNPKFQAVIDELGLAMPTKVSPTTGKTIPALGKNDPAFVQMCKAHPEHKAVWDARLACKSRLKESRSQRFIDTINPDGTIGIPLKYYAAHTGRFGGADKLNFQNMPRKSELRKCLTAPEGHFVYVADLSNIEARMLAWLSGQDDLLAEFRAGTDIYSKFASQVYNRPINADDNPTERFVGKTAVLGLGYGMGWKKFQATLSSGAAGPSVKLPDTQCQEIVNRYRAQFYKVVHLWAISDQILNAMISNNPIDYRVVSVIGNRIVLPNDMSLYYQDLKYTNNGFQFISNNEAIYTYGGKITENVIQALSRIVITDAILRISKIPENKVVLTVHDEIVVVAPDDNPKIRLQQIFDALCVPPAWAPDLPLKAEGGYDTCYSK